MLKKILALVVLAGSLLGYRLVGAHHGSGASYDISKRLTMTVTVTEFRYANPHPQLFFDTKDENGDVMHWVSELWTNPAFLFRAGWTKARSMQALQPGTVVTVTYAPSRSSETAALIYRIENEDGEEIVYGPPRI